MKTTLKIKFDLGPLASFSANAMFLGGGGFDEISGEEPISAATPIYAGFEEIFFAEERVA